MSKKIFFSLFLAIAVCGFWNCSKDEDKADPCSITWANDLANELQSIMNAAQAYGTNPTPANCIAYKQAAQAYLNALRPYGNCATLTGQDRVAWQNALNDAQESVDNIEC